MYSTFVAYLLWFLSFFGMAGFHRFYLGKIATGIIWMCTGGGFLIGTIYDFFTLPRQVQEANMWRALGNGESRRHSAEERPENWRYANDAQYTVVNNGSRKKERPEQIILKLAKENGGVLTVSDAALGADISVDEAKKLLDALTTKGFAELRTRGDGSLVYVIADLAGKDEPPEGF